jgi:hypothetical protein
MSTQALTILSQREMSCVQHYGDWMNERIVKVLGAKFYHRNADGSIFTPRILDAISFAPWYHVVVVDPEALWHFSKDKLAHQDTLDALTGAVQRPVRPITQIPSEVGAVRHGLAFVVLLKDIPAEPAVKLPKLIPLDLAHRPTGDYVIGFGLSATGEVWRPLPTLTHMIVAGSSDSGKSAFLRSLVYQVARQSLPVELYLADLEGLTFAWAEGWPILKAPIAQNLKAAIDITRLLLSEVDRRSELYRQSGGYPESWKEYRDLTGDTLPWVLVIFDEFSALADEAGKGSQFLQAISQLAMRARKFGMTLVFAGQDFKADLLNTRITNQLKTRVQFRAARREQSEVVLGQGGAERITTPGRALVRLDGEVTEVQAFWVPKSLVIGDSPASKVQPTLSNAERDLATWAIRENGGYLSLPNIQSRANVGPREARRLAESWERRGWLEKDPKARNRRRVTKSLAGAAGLLADSLTDSTDSTD